jgi:transposase
MVTDKIILKLRKRIHKEPSLSVAASKLGISENTAKKYLNTDKLPSELKPDRNWRTRPDSFSEVWPELSELLENNEGLEAKTLLEYLQRKYPGVYPDKLLRTLRRRVKSWKAVGGPAREVFFAQKHKPGFLCQSDFSSMNKLGITIQRQSFDHMIFHFVLTYSNWEDASICFSESFEALSEGLQRALFRLGAVPEAHQSDNLSAAVNNLSNTEEFTAAYQGLLRYYGINARKINPCRPNENGDIEQRHNRFKRALAQELMLRGSKDFNSRADYEEFLRRLLKRLNSGRKERLVEEMEVMKPLPAARLNTEKRIKLKVNTASTITVQKNIYSVHSRMIGEMVEVRIKSEEIEIWYAQRCVEKLPRCRGERNYRINYRHIIDSLVRKPGALENYIYREEMFPTSYFRVAYDQVGARNYLPILELAAKESETGVNNALRILLTKEEKITLEKVKQLINQPVFRPNDVHVDIIPLSEYDMLLEGNYD